jgi:protein-S-isoprenylcysteine O-methyltransferase Ste14
MLRLDCVLSSVAIDFTVRLCRLSCRRLLEQLASGLRMTRALGPILNTLIFTILVPGSVLVLIPGWILHGFPRPQTGPLTWVGMAIILLGVAIYFRCAWEFAIRGLGTPAPVAPTKFLVTTALHRYVRNPMYIGVFGVILGEAATFRSMRLLAYAAFFCVPVELFVIFYEEPTLRRQFGDSYEEYRRSVPRWIPKFRATRRDPGKNPA